MDQAVTKAQDSSNSPQESFFGSSPEA